MKKPFFYTLVILALILLVMNVYLTYDKGSILDVKSISADAIVTDHIGFMITNDSIMHFGKLVPDSGATRRFTLTNTYSGPILVQVKYAGEPWLTFSKSNFLLNKSQAINITTSANIPANASLGNYSWKISVILQKA